MFVLSLMINAASMEVGLKSQMKSHFFRGVI